MNVKTKTLPGRSCQATRFATRVLLAGLVGPVALTASLSASLAISLDASADVTSTAQAPFTMTVSSVPAAVSLEAKVGETFTFEIGQDRFLLNGEPFLIRCGEMHAARVPRAYWRHRLKLLKAMGMNTVCAYLFWNMHEPKPGEYNWEGRADIAEFCKIAQEEGLWVILRPGPYACAEWEMGGLPWWLLKHEDIKLRSSDPRFVQAASNYLKEVGRELTPLQVTNGGPILMVQVENEYGFYGKDSQYMGHVRQAVLDAGFDVPLFSCNPPYTLKNGYRDDLFPVVNFGSNPEDAFKALREILPQGPLMCGEFYPGWFDTWGNPHHRGDTARYLGDLKYMLDHDASFSIYMAHGGSSFGFSSGADRPFKPDTSSYDYDAPISEAGWIGPKFLATRELMAQYLLPGETLPEPPAPNPVMAFDPFELKQVAGVLDNLPEPIQDQTPKTVEYYDHGFGLTVYRTTIPAGPAGALAVNAIHDFGFVFIDGEQVGVMDRRLRSFSMNIEARKKPVTLDILVEPMGRVNFGVEVHDRKGLHGPVTFSTLGGEAQELKGWEIFCIPLGDEMPKADFQTQAKAEAFDGPAFYRGTFELKQAEDTFLDMRPWGKGTLWINGRCLGRFWNIGPTQTMYVPGPWLKEGENEIIVLDLVGPEKAVLEGTTIPILDQLRPELDLVASLRPERTLDLSKGEVGFAGQFGTGQRPQEIDFDQTVTGRQVAIEMKSSYAGNQYAAIAELDFYDTQGNTISHEGWTISYISSEERAGENGSAENAIDGQTANFWHSEWQNAKPNFPHVMVIDLGQKQTITGMRYVPRQGSGHVNGRIKDVRILVGDELSVDAED